MGSLKTLAFAGALAVGASTFAIAADYPYAPPPPPPPHEPLGLKGSLSSGVYLRGDVGVGQLNVGKYEQREVREFNGSFHGETQNQSVFAGVGVGYRFNNWFRVDGTFEYRGGGSFGVNDRVNLPPVADPNGINNRVLTNTYKGNISSMVALFNAYVDLGTWNCLTPYIGAGIGYARNSVSGLTDQGVLQPNITPFDGSPIFQVGASPTLATASRGDKSGIAWALMAGLGYEVNKNLTLEVGYRYLNLGDAQSGILRNQNRNETNSPLKAKDLDSHDIKIGMRWNFGEPECCGPTERPVYAPAPHVVRKY